MLFEFLHNDIKCYGLVTENSQTETLKIYILDCNIELGYELIFILKEGNEWDTNFSMKNSYPATFNNICKRLEEIFPWFKFSKKLSLEFSKNQNSEEQSSSVKHVQA